MVSHRLKCSLTGKPNLARSVSSHSTCRLDGEPFDCSEGVGEESQLPLGRLFRIELLERPGREVASVRGRLFATLHSQPIVPHQVRPGHVRFAADFEELRRFVRIEPQRHARHGADVVGDVVAAFAVAAGGGDRDEAVFIREGHGDAVDLEFDDVGRGRGATEEFANRTIPLAKFIRAISVVDGEHRHAMRDGFEPVDRCPADSLRRTVRRRQFRVLAFDLAQFGEEFVELAVGDFGDCIDVITAVVMVEQLPQLGGTGGL